MSSPILVQRLDINQVGVGRVADINIWNYQMTDAQVSSLTCGSRGNVVNASSLSVEGEENWYEDVSLNQYLGTGRFDICMGFPPSASDKKMSFAISKV